MGYVRIEVFPQDGAPSARRVFFAGTTGETGYVPFPIDLECFESLPKFCA